MSDAPAKKDANQYPPGWDHDRVAALAQHYDAQSDDEIADEIESAAADPNTVMVQVPRNLLAEVLKLIEAERKTA